MIKIIFSFFVYLLEIIVSDLLFAAELVAALFSWRKPRKVAKPVIWLTEDKETDEQDKNKNKNI